jgi:AbrB family looped-hinge helix DNA binding protein
MEITKLSTKGQVVIPENIRKDLEVGTAFNVFRKDDMVILKKIEGLTEKEKEEMEEINKIWKDIDEGKGVTTSKEEFLKGMDFW